MSGGYSANSKGWVFLTDGEGVRFWYGKYENYAHHQSDNPIEEGLVPVVLRVPDDADVIGELEEDALGTRDAFAPAWKTRTTIDPDSIEIWSGSSWEPITESEIDPMLAAEEDTYEGDDGEPITSYVFAPDERNPLSRPRFNGLGATPWVDRALTTHWAAIAAVVPPEWLPRGVRSSRGRFDAEEFGSGHYGVVMPTQVPGIVVKLTTDATEAAFVASALAIGQYDDAGLVTYKAVFRVPGAEHKGREVFVLWREAAEHVGFQALSAYARSHPQRAHYEPALRELSKWLGRYKAVANDVRERLKTNPDALAEVPRFADWARGQVAELELDRTPPKQALWGENRGLVDHLARVRGAQRIALGFAMLEGIEQWMENTWLCDAIGRAFSVYRDHGLLLADVHQDNIGLVSRMGDVPVITDPGHAVALDPRWTQVPIASLPSS